jgi:hypothetical protein
MENDRIYCLTHKRLRTGADKEYSLELRQNSNGGTEEYHKIPRQGFWSKIYDQSPVSGPGYR